MSATKAIEIAIDGQNLEVTEGTTVWQAAAEAGIDIPALCHDPKLDPIGVCRMCVVDVGERVLAPACTRTCQDGMTVETSTPLVLKHRKVLTELLLSKHPDPARRQRSHQACELESLARQFGLVDDAGHRVGHRPARPGDGPGQGVSSGVVAAVDASSPVITVDHAACILCDRCIRACDDLQNNHVIGRTGKGHQARIAFDLSTPMGMSSCVSCGECAASCPTDALTHKPITRMIGPGDLHNRVDTVCPYCGVGCGTSVYSLDDQIVLTEGRETPVSNERLCVKGRYGWDYTSHPQRLTKPLIRRGTAYPKGPLSGAVAGHGRKGGAKPGGVVDYDEVLPAFREATWQEALECVGRRLSEIRDEHGSSALAGFGSAKCSNEEAYLFQKLVRAGFGTNNVDHCTRLCHASSVAALMEMIGSGAVTNVFADVVNADVCLVTGAHPTSNHPVAATYIKQAVRQGTTLIVVDVRRHDLADFATHFAQIKPGSDVAFYNGVMHVLISEGMIDEVFVEERTEGFEALKNLLLAEYSPEEASSICGVEPDLIRAIARTIGGVPNGRRNSRSDGSPRLPRMLTFWGMGIAQHSHGTDNARCLISLNLLTGNVGKPGTGLHPLRGQNNVQGASDAGLIPMVYPDYQPISDPIVRRKFEAAWGRDLDDTPGMTVVEIMSAALTGDVRGMYILGENPFISDPNSNKVRKALAALDFLVVQDIFLTETAEFADVILPASSYFEKDGTYTNTDRRVQVGRKVLEPPGDAKPDWQVICEIARQVGLPMDYQSPADVFCEFASLTRNYEGLNHANLGVHGKLWPCPDPDRDDGTQVLFADRFPTANGRGKFVACRYLPAAEVPDETYPLVLTTGRILEHWHTGSMTRRSRALDAIVSDAFVKIHPEDLTSLQLLDRQQVRVSSRRGEIELQAHSDPSIEPGSVFIPFHFREAAANLLTNDVLDPDGKIPEFKYCAVRVEAVR